MNRQRKVKINPFLILMLLLAPALRLAALGTVEKKAASAETAVSTPERIIALGPVLTEEIYLLGAEARLVGNTTYCVKPPAARNKTKVGSVQEADLEKLISLKPDLVLATSLTNQAQVEKLKKLGLQVEIFSYPKSYEDICTGFLRLARLLNREANARTIIDQSRQEAAVISQSLATCTKTRVFVQVGADPLFTTPRDTFIHSLI
jgi:iron complex transport system substrate-binding protein